MADDQVVEPVDELVVEDVSPEPEAHPLEPGGKRFAEVYADMKDARRVAEDAQRTAQAAQAELDRLKRESAKPKETFYTADQLQAMVDQNRITSAVMADQLAYQRTRESEQRQERVRSEETKKSSALGEVNAYLDKMPALRSPSSEDFGKVAQEAYRISDETGLSVQDPRVQRLALRAVYGPLEKITKATQTREFDRKNADGYVETARGGPGDSGKKDPLKGVPQAYLDHWKALRYTKEQMVEESKYISPRKRS